MDIEISSMKAGMNCGICPRMLFVLCSLLFYFLLEENKSPKLHIFVFQFLNLYFKPITTFRGDGEHAIVRNILLITNAAYTP